MDNERTVTQKLVSVLSTPKDFFKEEAVKDTFYYYLFVNVIGFTLGYLWSPTTTSEYLSLMLRMIGIFFVSLFVYHFFVYLVGGRAGFTKTVQAYVYGSTPLALVWWAPWIPLFAFVYATYITIIGLQTLHSLTLFRAAMAYVIPYLCAILVLILPTVLWLA